MKNKINNINKSRNEEIFKSTKSNNIIPNIFNNNKPKTNFNHKLEIIGSLKVKGPDCFKFSLDSLFNKINKQKINTVIDKNEQKNLKFILYPKPKIKKVNYNAFSIINNSPIIKMENRCIQTSKMKPPKKLNQSSHNSTILNSTFYSNRNISSNIINELKINENKKIIKKINSDKNKKINIKFIKIFRNNKIINNTNFSILHFKKQKEDISVNTEKEIKKLFLYGNKRILTITEETQTFFQKELKLNLIEKMPPICFYSPKVEKKRKFKDKLIIQIINSLTIKSELKEIINKTNSQKKIIKIISSTEKNDTKCKKIKKIKKDINKPTINQKEIEDWMDFIKNPDDYIKSLKKIQIIKKPETKKFKINTKKPKNIYQIITRDSFYIQSEKSKNKTLLIKKFKDNKFNDVKNLSRNFGYEYLRANKRIQETSEITKQERKNFFDKNNEKILPSYIMDRKKRIQKWKNNKNCSSEIIGCPYNPYSLDWTKTILRKNFENTNELYTNILLQYNYPMYIRNYSTKNSNVFINKLFN